MPKLYQYRQVMITLLIPIPPVSPKTQAHSFNCCLLCLVIHQAWSKAQCYCPPLKLLLIGLGKVRSHQKSLRLHCSQVHAGWKVSWSTHFFIYPVESVICFLHSKMQWMTHGWGWISESVLFKGLYLHSMEVSRRRIQVAISIYRCVLGPSLDPFTASLGHSNFHQQWNNNYSG